MCIVVRFVNPEAQSKPWNRAKLVINVPWSVTRGAAMLIVRETLRLLGIEQHHEVEAVCFCGEAVDVPPPSRGAAQTAAALIDAELEVMQRGA